MLKQRQVGTIQKNGVARDLTECSPGKCGVSPNVTDAFDDSVANQRTQGETGEIGAEHQS